MAGGCDQQHGLLAYKAGNQITHAPSAFPPHLLYPVQVPSPWDDAPHFPAGSSLLSEAFPETPSQSECISLVTVNIDRSTRLTATKLLHKRLCNAKEMRHLSRGRYFLSVPPGSRGHLSGARVSSFSPEVSLMSLE